MRWLAPALTLLAAGCAGLAPPTPPSAPPSSAQHAAQLETELQVPLEAAGTPPAPTSDICSTAELALPGVITRVVDGDTADVLLEGDDRPTRVRFYGIDTPERGQPMYRSATEELQVMIGGEAIDLVPTEQRTFDRIVGTVCVGAVNVNKEMVRRGYAWAYRQYLGAEDGDEDYCRLEAQARQQGLGLWSLQPDERVAPWEYRRRGGGRAHTDYGEETAEQCIAAMAKGRRSRSRPPAAPPTPPPVQRAGCDIKGNINKKGERIYHVPGSRSYNQTKIDESEGDRWFCSEQEARENGWRPPR